jgi:hypothetical protein
VGAWAYTRSPGDGSTFDSLYIWSAGGDSLEATFVSLPDGGTGARARDSFAGVGRDRAVTLRYVWGPDYLYFIGELNANGDSLTFTEYSGSSRIPETRFHRAP